MNTARAKEILDQLDIEYKDVRRGSFLYVIMSDDTRIPFSKLIREHKKHTSDDVAEIMFSPTPASKEDTKYNVDAKAETEVIVKKKRKNNK